MPRRFRGNGSWRRRRHSAIAWATSSWAPAKSRPSCAASSNVSGSAAYFLGSDVSTRSRISRTSGGSSGASSQSSLEGGDRSSSAARDARAECDDDERSEEESHSGIGYGIGYGCMDMVMAPGMAQAAASGMAFAMAFAIPVAIAAGVSLPIDKEWLVSWSDGGSCHRRAAPMRPACARLDRRSSSDARDGLYLRKSWMAQPPSTRSQRPARSSSRTAACVPRKDGRMPGSMMPSVSSAADQQIALTCRRKARSDSPAIFGWHQKSSLSFAHVIVSSSPARRFHGVSAPRGATGPPGTRPAGTHGLRRG